MGAEIEDFENSEKCVWVEKGFAPYLRGSFVKSP